MSFDVNVLSSKPVIQAAANMQNDGGAGNLGYMAQDKKEKEHKESVSIFAQKPKIDTFSMSGKLEPVEEDFDIVQFFTDIIKKIMSIFK